MLVDDILCLAKDFSVLSFNCINANCNRAAQALATKALSSLSEQVWLEDLFYLLFNLIINKNSLSFLSKKELGLLLLRAMAEQLVG